MGEQKQRVVVSKANIQINVSIPRGMASKFSREARVFFIELPEFSCGFASRSGSRVRATIPISFTQDFYEFVRRFCDENDLIPEFEE